MELVVDVGSDFEKEAAVEMKQRPKKKYILASNNIFLPSRKIELIGEESETTQ